MKKIKLTKKILMAFAITTLALASTKHTSFAMQSTNEIIPTRVDSDIVKQQAQKNAEQFLNWAEAKGIDLKTTRIVIVENGGNYDLTDAYYNYLDCEYKGKKIHSKVNLGLDQLKGHILESFDLVNKSLNENEPKIVAIVVNPLTDTAENVKEVNDKIKKGEYPSILNAIPKKQIAGVYNFGGQYYGTANHVEAINQFLTAIEEETGYRLDKQNNRFTTPENRKEIPILYLMINECSEHNAGGFELYHSSSEDSKDLAKTLYKNCDALGKHTRSKPIQLNTTKQITSAANKYGLAGVLAFVGFGDFKHDQKRILDEKSLKEFADQVVFSLASWLNYHPRYACVTIEPTKQPWVFEIKAHMKNLTQSDLNNNNHYKIVIGRADLSEDLWNKTKNDQTLSLNENMEIKKNFNALTDGTKEQHQNDDISVNNKFYIDIYDGNGRRVLADTNHFQITGSDEAMRNSFTRFDI